jgi:hypothetical protein
MRPDLNFLLLTSVYFDKDLSAFAAYLSLIIFLQVILTLGINQWENIRKYLSIAAVC